MSFPATYGDLLYARHVLREARRGKSARVDRKLRDRELLRRILAAAFASDFVKFQNVEPRDVYLYRGACRVCGCTDENCADCIAITGEPCHWIRPGFCSACLPMELTRNGVRELARIEKALREW